MKKRAPHGVVELVDEAPPLHRELVVVVLHLFLRRQGIQSHTRSRYAKSSSNKAAQLRRAPRARRWGGDWTGKETGDTWRA